MRTEGKSNDGSEIFLTKWNWKDIIYFVLLHFRIQCCFKDTTAMYLSDFYNKK